MGMGKRRTGFFTFLLRQTASLADGLGLSKVGIKSSNSQSFRSLLPTLKKVERDPSLIILLICNFICYQCNKNMYLKAITFAELIFPK